MVPIIFFLSLLLNWGFAWDRAEKGWVRVSLPPLRMMTGPVQHFRSAILDAWRFSVFAKLSETKGFLGGEYADFQGSLQLLTSSQLRERDKMLLRAILCGVFGTDPSWQGQEGRRHLFWECSFLPPQHVRDLPEFATLMSLNLSNWPRCLLWHGWLPGLSGLSDKDPWATSFGDLASFHLERCLGAYPVDFATDYWDAADVALEMPEHPNIWTDGSREDFSSLGGFEVAGAGVFLPASAIAF